MGSAVGLSEVVGLDWSGCAVWSGDGLTEGIGDSPNDIDGNSKSGAAIVEHPVTNNAVTSPKADKMLADLGPVFI
ncbi:MAG: hypothetical protein F2609_04110 [Actinobacteria bacterium]|nr:hypothetical protein [Actinomycetota bacterium]